MIAVGTARQLHAAGLRWDPAPGDRFVIDRDDLRDDVFWVSDLTVETHRFGGETVLGFNGTTEWALDSVPLEATIWLPREDQLRAVLGAMFHSLERLPGAPTWWRLVTVVAGQESAAVGEDVEELYAGALLRCLR